MDGLLFFLAAFGLSLIGSLPFGVINLNILAASVNRGRIPALWMALGAVLIEGGQLLIILVGFQQLADNPEYERVLHFLALPIFLSLSVYYFLAKPKTALMLTASGRPFWRGVGLSFINVLVYPFWLFWLTWLDFPVDIKSYWIYFIGGAILGAFASMLFFIYLGKVITSRTGEWTHHLNRIIALIFLGLALVEIIRWWV